MHTCVYDSLTYVCNRIAHSSKILSNSSYFSENESLYAFMDSLRRDADCIILTLKNILKDFLIQLSKGKVSWCHSLHQWNWRTEEYIYVSFDSK